jgi:colanic acid biosynthesis glycosyl transferase WcaI
MMDWLARNGFVCTVVTTYPYYPYWKVQSPYKNRWYKKERINYGQSESSMTIYRCPSYVPSNPTGLKRMIQDASFWSSMLWTIVKMIIKNDKFDLIITVAPPFHLAYLGLLLRKYTGGKLLYHVQDLQIEAAQDLNMLSNNKLFEKLYKIEKGVLDKADFVSSISAGMIKKRAEKVQKEIQFFPNWVDTTRFFPITDREKLKEKWNFQTDDKVFLYSGAIGEKQGLESILHAAEKLIHNNKIKFIICGSGPYKEKLIEIANNAGLINVSFLPVQEMDVFNEFLNMADLHLILQKSNESDLVMPSKLTTILAVGGVSLVTAPEGTSLYETIDQYNLGYVIEPENTELLCKTIAEIKFDTSFELKKQKSREYALKYLNIDNVMNEFLTNFA